MCGVSFFLFSVFVVEAGTVSDLRKSKDQCFA